MEGEERRRGWIHPPLSLSLSHFFSSFTFAFSLSYLVGGLTLVTYQHLRSCVTLHSSKQSASSQSLEANAKSKNTSL